MALRTTFLTLVLGLAFWSAARDQPWEHPASLPTIVAPAAAAVWKTAVQSTFHEDPHSGVFATISVTNLDRGLKETDRLVTTYFDALGRRCFQLIFDLRVNQAHETAPLGPGQTRTLLANTSLVFPASQPVRATITEYQDGQFTGPPSLDQLSIPPTITSAAQDAWGALRTDGKPSASLGLFIAEAVIAPDARLSKLTILRSQDRTLDPQITTLCRNLRFAQISESQEAQTVFLMGVLDGVSTVSPPRNAPLPDRNDSIRKAVSRADGAVLPLVEVLIFQYVGRDGVPAEFSKSPESESRSLAYIAIGTDWCGELFQIVKDPFKGLVKNWSKSINYPQLKPVVTR